MLLARTRLSNFVRSGKNPCDISMLLCPPEAIYTTPRRIRRPAGMIVPIIPPHLLILPTQPSPLRAMKVATQYMASTVISVNNLLEAKAASEASFSPIYAKDTAPKVNTVGYHMVDSIHCSHIARNPVRGPKASPTQRNTPPCLSENIAAISAATIAVGIRNTMAAKR